MSKVEVIALQKLSEAFDEFVRACMDESGKSKAPDSRALAKARGYLPPYCAAAYKRAAHSALPSQKGLQSD